MNRLGFVVSLSRMAGPYPAPSGPGPAAARGGPGVAWCGFAGAVALACLSSTAAADPVPFRPFPTPTFVETRFLQRHAGEDLPPPMLLPQMAWAPVSLPARGPVPEEWSAPRKALAAGADTSVIAGSDGIGDAATIGTVTRRDLGDTTIWAGIRGDQVNPYTDGGNARVAYSYERLNTQMAVSHRFRPGSRLTVFGLRDGIEEGRTPHSSVDTPQFQRGQGNLLLDHAPAAGPFDRVEAAASISTITYASDNWSLRSPGALGLRYEGDWITYRGLVRGEFTSGDWRNSLTADVNRSQTLTVFDTRFATQGRSSYRLPDVETTQAGVAWSAVTAPQPGDALSAGLRLDAVQSRAAMAHAVPSASGNAAALFNISPQQLYDAYYGAGIGNDPFDVNLSGRAQYRRSIGDGAIYGEIRRLVRTPDSGERFYGSSGPAAFIQVGNPGLSPEAHHAVELGGDRKGAAWQLSGKVWYDRVAGFITPDRARGQDGILRSDAGIVYRNVDAYLAGAGLDGRWGLADGLGARMKLAWMRGGNLSDHRPLYQIAPLQGEAVIEHRRTVGPDLAFNAGASLRFAAGQHRVDDSTATGSAQDTGGPTGGYGLVDLFAGLVAADRFAVTLGIANLLDKRYQMHVNPLPQGVTTQPLAAPGRSLFLTATMTF
jgi:iron complex outermembrane receptor protein